MKNILIRGLFISAFLFPVSSLVALTISPARIELAAQTGDTLTRSFAVINEQDTDQTYYISIENFVRQGVSGTSNFTSSKEGLPGWMKVQDKVILKKGERVTVPYSIAVPKYAEAKDYAAAIFLSTVPPVAGEGQVPVGAKVGTFVLLKVTGGVITLPVSPQTVSTSTKSGFGTISNSFSSFQDRVASTTGDIDPNAVSTCLDLKSDRLRYKAGDSGTNGEVSELQDFLISISLLKTQITGFFGLSTFQAVKQYQRISGLSPTGYVGPITRAKIKKDTCN
jgi:hypothetical protein